MLLLKVSDTVPEKQAGISQRTCDIPLAACEISHRWPMLPDSINHRAITEPILSSFLCCPLKE